MPSPLTIDVDQARQFLAQIAPGEAQFVFQTLDDRKVNPGLNRVLVGTLEGLVSQLEFLQQQGAGVFVQVQGGYRRGKDHVTHGRVVFADLDDPSDFAVQMGQADSELPDASIVVETSPGKAHLYWLTEPYDAQLIKSLLTDTADIIGTDGNVLNTDRVLRLPGSWHQKAEPRQVRITGGCGARYQVDDLLRFMSTASRRGMRVNRGAGVKQKYDPVFGLPIQESIDEIDSLPAGDRTQKLVSMAGQLVGQGWSAERVEQILRERAEALRPEGDPPVSETAWEREILPAIGRFMSKDRGIGPALPPVAPRQVPGLPQAQPPITPPPAAAEAPPAPAPTQVPPVPAGAVSPPSGLNDPVPVDPYAPTLYNDTTLSLEHWLERFVYVEKGQLVVDLDRPMVSAVYPLEDFKKSMSNCRVGDTLMINKWLSNPWRKTVYSIVFRPGQPKLFKENETSYLNSFEMPPPVTAETFDPNQLEPFFEHMQWLFPDPRAWRRMLNWMAMTLQRPDVRIPWAPVLVSRQGTGKSWLFECIDTMFGGMFCSLVEHKELEQNYNAFMGDSVLVWFEEVHSRRKYEMIDKFKTIINGTKMEINEKFGGKGQRPIFANVAMTSNHNDALAITFEDMRRYWVYYINRPKLPTETSTALYGWLKTDGPQHLRYYLEQLDISNWAFNAPPPITPAFRKMVRYNMSLVQRALSEAMEDRFGVFQVDLGSEQQVETTLALKLDQDKLDKKQRMELQHLLREHTDELDPVRVRGNVLRPVVWRNYQRWVMQPAEVVEREFNRAKTASLGHTARAELQSVDGGVP